MVHKSGVEIQCDLYGLYVHILIDMQEERGNSYEFEICSLAILGTIAQTEPVTEEPEAEWCPLVDDLDSITV